MKSLSFLPEQRSEPRFVERQVLGGLKERERKKKIARWVLKSRLRKGLGLATINENQNQKQNEKEGEKQRWNP